MLYHQIIFAKIRKSIFINASITLQSYHSSNTHYDIIIIGAGASGLFCAMTAGKHGKSVLVLDHADKIGKKILMSGGGRCNFTNYDVTSDHFLCQNPHFVKSALSAFSPWDFISLVHAHNIAYVEKDNGQLFCQNSAKDIVNMLHSECNKTGVVIHLNTSVNKITSLTDNINQTDCKNFQIDSQYTPKASRQKSTQNPQNTQDKRSYTCKSLVIATGGLSIPSMGATGFGYQIASQFNHQITATQASLVPFTFTDKYGELFKQLSGTSILITAFNDKIGFTLPMLFTHRGLSGPAILQLSNYWQAGEQILLDLFVGIDMADALICTKKTNPKKRLSTVISELNQTLNKPLPKKVLTMLQTVLFDNTKDIELANIKDDTLQNIGRLLNAWVLTPSGTEGYRTAEITRGGVDTTHICPKTMQSKLQDNLYFIGEVLDVTGHLGGYNFQWAWASAFVCANALV